MAEKNPLSGMKGSKQSSVYDSPERAKGFSQKGIPKAEGLMSIGETGASATTPADRETNEQKASAD